jgi:putative NIF3 family GTP cyclohydrolase 1 type 2
LVETKGGFGHGVIGELAAPMKLSDFAARVAEVLPVTARKVVFSGEPGLLVRFVALCSGAGDSFLPNVLASNADVYVTSDLRHHPALDAISTPREQGPLALIDVSHWAAESLWVTNAISKLSTLSGIDVVASATVTDPWTQEVN